MKELEPEIIDLNTSQLEIGRDSQNALLPEYEYDSYSKLKRSMGSKSGNRYDLKLEGDFYSAFFGAFEGDDLRIDSKDEKRDKLVTLTSIEIFGLTNNNTRKFVNELFYPLFMDKVRNQLSLN